MLSAELWPLLPAQVQQFSVIVSLLFTGGITWLGYWMARGKYRRC